jgi:hypothetical protein
VAANINNEILNQESKKKKTDFLFQKTAACLIILWVLQNSSAAVLAIYIRPPAGHRDCRT